MSTKVSTCHNPKWGVIIQDIDAAAKGRANQVIVPALQLDIAECDGRRAGYLVPVLAAVDREVDTEFSAQE